MTPDASLNTLEALVRHGINYICGVCGALLYHIGPDDASEGGETGFAPRQPWEVVKGMKSCPICGHTLNPDPDPNTIKLQKIQNTEKTPPKPVYASANL
jgi:hypothetical protein